MQTAGDLELTRLPRLLLEMVLSAVVRLTNADEGSCETLVSTVVAGLDRGCIGARRRVNSPVTRGSKSVRDQEDDDIADGGMPQSGKFWQDIGSNSLPSAESRCLADRHYSIA